VHRLRYAVLVIGNVDKRDTERRGNYRKVTTETLRYSLYVSHMDLFCVKLLDSRYDCVSKRKEKRSKTLCDDEKLTL
jgi:hypothetical protein